MKTVADYMSLADDVRVELFEGTFYVTPSPDFRHQRICLALAARLDAHARACGAGDVVTAPFDVILSDEDVVQPDLVFVAASHAERIRDRLHGPPDLAIEILSAAHAERDRIVKREIYRQHGVPEYWIVDGAARAVEVLVLEAGAWRLHGIFDAGDILTSVVLPDLRLDVAGVFA